MKKTFSLIISLSFFVIILNGCGKHSLESGNIVNDSSLTSIGRFDCQVVDVPGYENGFICESAYCSDSGYQYVLADSNFYLFPFKYYYLNVDLDGKVIVSEPLSLPVYADGNKLILSSDLDVSELSGRNFSIENGYISYLDFNFDDKGILSSVCRIGATYEESGITNFLYDEFEVKWDAEGKCVSVSSLDEYEYIYSEAETIYDNDPVNDYLISESGIYMIDDQDKYVSEYFDFLNSDIRPGGFNTAVIRDDNYFSGIYTDVNGKSVIACFTKNSKNYNDKTIYIVASGYSDALAQYAYDYNTQKSGFRIAMTDYSIRTDSGEDSEAWEMIKNDINNGLRPDIIVNTTGYDEVFVNSLNEASLLSDLKEVIDKDEALDGVSFTVKADSMFYDSDNIYCVVPSYSYYTVVGNEDNVSGYVNWGYQDFADFTSGFDGERSVFFLDTKLDFVQRVLDFDGSDYVDFSNKQSAFNCDEYISFLKFASTLPDDSNAALAILYNQTNNGMCLINDVACHNIGDMNKDATVYSMGDYIDIGFPHGTSGTGSGVISADLSIMIMSTNAYTNECWDFCKQFLYPEYQDGLRAGIPVTQTGFDNWECSLYSTEDLPDQNIYVKDGIEYTIPYASEDVIYLIESRINNCNKVRFSEYTIEQIAIKYATQYFDGMITAEEAAELTDKEVLDYLMNIG